MRLLTFVAPLLLSLTMATRVAAQCIVGDGLDGGPACTGAFTQVPQGKFVQPSLGICWQNCGVAAVVPYRAQWGTLTPFPIGTPGTAPSCGWYTSALTLFQSGNPMWQGTMTLTYSRTWAEIAPSGGNLQVWRYLVNGDLRATNVNPGPCGLPPCCPANGNRMRVTGYIDYAQSCVAGAIQLESAWMLTHGCDSIDHVAGFPRAGAFHPGRFYSFVGPSAGFSVGAGSVVESGTTATECVRRWDATALPARCDHEEPLLFATFNPSGTTCMCGVGPGLWYEAFFNAAGNTGTTITPYPGSDPFRSYPIGTWTNPAAYPGVEQLRWNTNDLQYVECTGVGRQEYYFGVTTSGGFPALTIPSIAPGLPVPLPLTFIDQANSVLLPANVVTRNVPYRSDHILNLNL
ncbi:MAG: hypothetical protein ACKVWV_14600 [Planctomycetota bacterium]